MLKSSASKIKSVAIVEINPSHDECILTQLKALKSAGHKTTLITIPEVLDRNKVFLEMAGEVLLIKEKDKREVYRALKKIYKKLRKSGLDTLVLNTARGSVIKKLCLSSMFDKVEFVGIAHNTKNFKGSVGQKVINRKVKKFLVLAKFLQDQVNHIAGLKFGYFYPQNNIEPTKHEKKTKTTVTIVGGVENIKKDLDGFCNLIAGLKSNDVEFIFLGRSNSDLPDVVNFNKRIEDMESKVEVLTYDSFVDADEFTRVLHKTDLILPLIHPDTESGEIYFKSKISGSMNVALSAKVPLLLHESLEPIEELNSAAIYYNFENFESVIKDEALREDKRKELTECSDYSDQEQQNRYLKLLFG